MPKKLLFGCARAMCAAVLVIAFTTATALAQDDWVPLIDLVGDAYEPHSPYENNLDLEWTIHGPPCATEMRIVFGSIDIEYWYDWVEVAGQRLYGSHSSYVTAPVTGNRIDLWFHSDYSITRAGYEIESIEAKGCPAPLTCDDVTCGLGEFCELQEIVCVTWPCYPQPTCVPDNSDFCPRALCPVGTICSEEEDRCIPSCLGVECGERQHCELQEPEVCNSTPCDPEPVCVWDEPGFCASILCPPHTICDEEMDLCVPTCDGYECAEGEHCELLDVVCVTEPCLPQPSCVANAITCEVDTDCPTWHACNSGVCEGFACTMQYEPVCGVDGNTYGNACVARANHVEVDYLGECEVSFCATVRCAAGHTCSEEERRCVPSCDGFVCEAGEHCELREVQCFTTPCDPMPHCVADNDDVVFEGPGGLAIPDADAAGIAPALTASGLGAGTYLVYLSLDITHTWRGDLRVTLTSPTGQEVVVHDRTGSSADDLVLSEELIGGFSGEDFNGTWTLSVSDNARYDTGRVNSWSLRLMRPVR